MGGVSESGESMKKIFTAPSVVPCDMLRALLDSAGVPAMIKNEHGSAIAGIGYPVAASPSVAFAWPEVWVNEEDFEKAAELLAQFQAGQSDGASAGTR